MRYRIDGEDRLASVSQDWEAFARENGARALTAEAVIGRRIWNFLSGRAVEYHWRAIFEAVRSDGQARRIRIRCDGPRQMRALALNVAPQPGGAVEIAVRTERDVPARYHPLWDRARPRGAGQVTACAWCKSIRLGPRRWLPVDEAAMRLSILAEPHPPEISHGVCHSCAAGLQHELALAAA